MDEYKQYIHEKISQIPMHPTRMSESISIHISEAGFEAMKNDPEYEAWVLNDLRTGWAQPDRWAGVCGGAYSTIYYGATKEECHAEMWSAGYQNGSGKSLFDGRAKDSFGSAGQSRKTDGGADKKGAGKEKGAGRSQREGGDGKKRCTQAADVTVGKRGRIFRFRSGKIGDCGNSKCRL